MGTRAADLTIITTNAPDAIIAAYSYTLSATGGTPPYYWSVSEGTLPLGLGISNNSELNPDDTTNGVISGTPDLSVVPSNPQPFNAATNEFVVQVTDSLNAVATNLMRIVVYEGWSHPTIIAGDYTSEGTGGIFNWSDPTTWVGGKVPSNVAGTVVTLDDRMSANSTNVVDGTFTVGAIRSRNLNVVSKTGGTGKLIFNNGSLPSIWNFHSRITRFSTLRGDIYVDMQLDSDLDIRFATARQEEATVGRIGRQISGTGHLTLTLSQNDASATRFTKLGVGVTNTYSGGTTVRHISRIGYGTRHGTQNAITLNAVSTSAFGTGDVTLDGTGCTTTLPGAPTTGKGMWIKFSTNDVIRPGARLNLITRGQIMIDLAANTTNTAYVSADGVHIPAGTYTGGNFAWLYGAGQLVVLNDDPPPAILVTTETQLPNAFEDAAYSVTLEASGGMQPYTWSLVDGTLPGLTLSPSGVISGTAGAPTLASFTVRVTDSNGIWAEKQLDLRVHSVVPPKRWNIPVISIADYMAQGSGSFTWSDTNVWKGGVVPNAAGKYVTIEPRMVISNSTTVTIDGSYTMGGLLARNTIGETDILTGPGKLIFDNGTNKSVLLWHRLNTRVSSLWPDIYVDLQLNSDLDLVMGAMRADSTTVQSGRVGKEISGTGHLTLNLASTDATATRFHRLGEGVTNTYSGGTTVRHPLSTPYGTNDTSWRAVNLEAKSEHAFGTGDVTLDATESTQNGAYQNLGNFGRGMWVKLSATDAIAKGRILNLVRSDLLTLELAPETTNTVQVMVDGKQLCPGLYTGGSAPWLFGSGYLKVTGSCGITSEMINGNLILSWQGIGTLESAPVVTGPYAPVDFATSPYMVPSLAEGQQYYRLRLEDPPTQ